MSNFGSLSSPIAKTTLKLPASVGKAREAVNAWMGRYDRRKVAGRTYAYRRDNGQIDVVLYETTIVSYLADGSIRLNTGGFKTVATRDMINMLLPKPWRVWTTDAIWYLGKRPNRWEGPASAVVAFADGLTIDARGAVSGATTEGEQRKLKKTVKAFVATYLDKLFAGELPKPSGADCWICAAFEEGKAHGDHVHEHIAEDYYVPRMIVNAIKETSVSPVANNALCIGWGSDADKERARRMFDPKDPHSYYRLARRQLERSLTRYVRRRVGLGDR